MDKDRKKIKIYQNEMNNNLSNRKRPIPNQYKEINPPSEQNERIFNQKNAFKNGMIYQNKKIQDNSSISNNRYRMENKIQKPEKFINNNDNNINREFAVNNINKKYINPLVNSATNKGDRKKIFIQSVEKNNFSQTKNEMDKREQKPDNFNKYSFKYKYIHNSNNANSLLKNVQNKSIEKDKNKNIKINTNNELPTNNNVKKNFITLKKPSTRIVENNNININQNNEGVNKSIRPISSNQNYTNYFKLPNGGHVFHFNNQNSIKYSENKQKDDKIEKTEKEKSNEINYPDSFLCFKCQEIVNIKLNPDSLTINTNCKNGHDTQNIPINDFVNKNSLIKNGYIPCSSCKKNFEKKNFLFLCSCNLIICKNCINSRKHNTHSQIQYSQKNYFCRLHKKAFTSFCNNCNKNICYDCIADHLQHKDKIIYFKNIIPTEKEIRNYKNGLEKIKMAKEKFNRDVDGFLELFKEKRNEFNKKADNLIQVQKDIIEKMNNKEILNYENINNFKNMNLDKNLFDNYLKIENNFNKKGKFLLNLFDPEDIQAPKYKIKKEVKNFEIKGNKIVEKKLEINKEININIFSEKNNKEIKNFNIICTNINNIFINNSMGNHKSKQEKVQNQSQKLKGLKNVDNNINNQEEAKKENIIPNGNTKSKVKTKDQKKIAKKFEVIQKIENCEKKFEKKEERCITCFTLLQNNRIVITFKGGIIKFYEFTKKKNEILLIELVRLEEDEYCFNYAIELQDRNVAACSEDGTVKIFKLLFDENIDQKIKMIQLIKEMNNDPIYIIKELENQSLALGCWKNILIYQKASEYELINKIKLDEYTFSILEISPNEIIASHTESKSLTGHNLNNYQFYSIKNVESNENTNIICKYQNKRDIIFVAYDKGINIVSIVKKMLIKNIVLNEIISSLCPIEMNVDIGDGNKKIWGLMLGAKRKIYGEKVNFAYSMLQVGFNLNEKDEGNLTDDENKNIEMKIISRKDRIHYYDVNNLQNSLWDKNKDTLEFIENKDEQWMFSSGNEDKLIKIWKFK